MLNIERFSFSKILREIRVIRVQTIYALWAQKTGELVFFNARGGDERVRAPTLLRWVLG